jgi:acetyl-CoA synthetase
MADTAGAGGKVSSVMQETRVFPPPAEFSRRARIGSLDDYRRLYDAAATDPEGFWDEPGRQLPWMKPYTKVLDWQPPAAAWFVGGQTNASAACLDQQIAAGRGDKPAIVWVGEPTGERRTYTYRELHAEVARFAAGLKKLGVKRGDVVSIYMPMTPELVIAMLGCARIGAVHSVIFGGFSSEAIADRNHDAQAVAVITADGGWRRGAQLPLKKNVDAALTSAAHPATTVKHVIVLERTGQPVDMVAGRDVWWHDLVAGMPADLPAEPMDSEAPLFILYTSGSTGKPKGIKHTTAGYILWAKTTAEWVFDLRDDDLFWCTADCGWITGHSYVTYGPLGAGREHPDLRGGPQRAARRALLGDHRAGEADDLLHRAHGDPLVHEVGHAAHRRPRSLQLAAARHGGGGHQSRGLDVVPRGDRREALPDRRHLVADRDGRDHDEPLPGCTPTKPGSCTLPLPGVVPEIVDAAGHPVRAGRGGWLVMQKPWPGCSAASGATTRGSWRPIGRRCPGSISPATTPGRMPTATTGSWGGSTTCSTWPATGCRRWGSSRIGGTRRSR